MRFFDYFRTAAKNLRRQKLRTFLTIFAIVIGALSVILMISLIVGARNAFYKQMEAMGSLTQVTVVSDPDSGDLNGGGNLYGKSDSKLLDNKIVNQLKVIDHVTAVSPSIGVPFSKMYLEGQTKKTWSRVVAYEPQAAFDKNIIAGRNLEGDDVAKIVVTTGFLKNYGGNADPKSALGKNVIFEANGNYSGYGAEPQKQMQCETDADCKQQQMEQEKKITKIPAEIVGVANTMDDTDYINMKWARMTWTDHRYENKNCDMKKQGPCPATLVTTDNIAERGYGSILLKVDSTDNVKKVGETAKKLGVSVVTAEEMITQIMKIFTTVGLILGAIGGIALFVAAIGIINTMIMATYERTREIGVMRAAGATKATVRRLFTFEAAMLGFWGGVFGLLLAYIISLVGNFVAGKIASTEGLPIKGIITFPIWLILGVLVFTTLIGILAGLYPAYRAAKLDPVEALRYE